MFHDPADDSPEGSPGFTLIELLVVISIIGLLSSVIIVSLAGARSKAHNAKRIVEMRSIQTALQLFYDENLRMPYNHSGGPADAPTYVEDAGLASWGECDAPMPGLPGGGVETPGCPSCAFPTLVNPQAYNASMQELVDAGFLREIPHSHPSGAGYCYVDTGPGNPVGAIVVTILSDTELTTAGPPGSCRPYPSANGTWCESGQPNTSACYCTPY